MALFNCDGTVSRMKHLCDLVPYDGHRAGVAKCNNYETPLGCPHSQTTRAVPHQAIYRHVCDQAYKSDAESGIRPKWKPTIKKPATAFVTSRSENGGKLKDSMQFWWCDGHLRTLEQVFGESAGPFPQPMGDLLHTPEEVVCKLIGKGTYEHWVGVWSGNAE